MTPEILKPVNWKKLAKLEAHPLADLFPMAEDEVVSAMAIEIAERGYRYERPIILLDGKILDGRNRRKATVEAGEKCSGTGPSAYVKDYSGEGGTPLDFVISENLNRRHLTTPQRAIIAANIATWERGMNQHEAAGGSANLQTQKPTAKQVAQKMSISERALHSARAIRERGSDELVASVASGKLSIHSAEALLELGDEELSAVLVGERKEIVSRAQEIREQNKANLRAAVGTDTRSKEERGENFYQTPVEATLTLLAHEKFGPLIWEPACGHGAISKQLEKAGYDVRLSDLIDRQCADRDGVCQEQTDFLKSRKRKQEADIVTNPPYGEVLNAFIAHALREHRPAKMAMLLNLNALCGFANDDRNFWMDDFPPARIYVFKRRLPMMHQEGWTGKKSSSRMNTAWFVWEQDPSSAEFPYGTKTEMRRVDWKDHAGEKRSPE